jgi:hypothetical protein
MTGAMKIAQSGTPFRWAEGRGDQEDGMRKISDVIADRTPKTFRSDAATGERLVAS